MIAPPPPPWRAAIELTLMTLPLRCLRITGITSCMKSATWVKPRLVAQIAFAEWTAGDKLRQPVFLGLRRDKSPRECRWDERER